ncbi:hypothetical protein CPB83DRAFT_909378 [Crepidotus variabilis]|uniref:Uncharacterized protein n=1 Tax=Crepidotus variabilis TaxID=179855 RepID=A0A9P6EA04_9AGAR|nr:hypothetical protein CPB83DRAFT_909378 [Crepidotus variabilis]
MLASMKDCVGHQQSAKAPDSFDDSRLTKNALESLENRTSSSSTHSFDSPIDLSFRSPWDSDSEELSEDLGPESAILSINSLALTEAQRFDSAPSSLRKFCYRLVRRALTDPGLLHSFPEIYALVDSSTTSDDITVHDIAASLYVHLCDILPLNCTNIEEETTKYATTMPDNASLSNQSAPVDDEVLDLCSHPMRILYGNVWDEFKNDAPSILDSHALLTYSVDETFRQSLKERQEEESQDQEQKNHGWGHEYDDDCIPSELTDLNISSTPPVEIVEEAIYEKDISSFLKHMLRLPLFLILSLLVMLFSLFLLGSFGHLSTPLFPFRRPIFIITDFWDDLYLWLKFGIDPSGRTVRLMVALQPYSILDRLIALLCIS